MLRNLYKAQSGLGTWERSVHFCRAGKGERGKEHVSPGHDPQTCISPWGNMVIRELSHARPASAMLAGEEKEVFSHRSPVSPLQ